MNEILITDLLDEQKCYELIRQIRWQDGVRCPECGSEEIRKNGHDNGLKHRQRYACKSCNKSFTDLTHTVIASNHIPIQHWMVCWILKDKMSNKQMAAALDLPPDTVAEMRYKLSDGIVIDSILKQWDWD